MGPSFGSGVTVLGANVLGRLLNCLAWDIALKTRMAPRKAPSKATWLHYSSVEPSLLHKLECMYCLRTVRGGKRTLNNVVILIKIEHGMEKT